MNKLMIMMFALFLVAGMMAPAAVLAESGSGSDGDGSDDSDSDSDDSDDSSDDDSDDLDDSDDDFDDSDDDDSDDSDVRVKYKARMRDGRQEIRYEYRERMNDHRVEIKERFKERFESQRERFEERKEEFRDRMENRKENFQEHKDRLVDVRERLRDCDSDECTRVREEYKDRAGDFLVTAGSKIMAHLDRLENFVNENLEGDVDFLSDIDALRLDVELFTDELDGLENLTQDELTAYKEDLQALWGDVKALTEEIKDAAVVDRAHNSFNRLRNLQGKLEETRDRLADAGADVTQLDTLLVSFAEALDAQDTADTAGEIKAHFKDAVHMIKEIQHEIRDLRHDLTGEGDDDDEDADDADEGEDPREEAEEEIAEAEEEIATAREKIDEHATDGGETGASEQLMIEAEDTLADAKTAFDAEDYETAEELAEAAHDLAQDARMKYLGKTLEELEEDRADGTDDTEEFTAAGSLAEGSEDVFVLGDTNVSVTLTAISAVNETPVTATFEIDGEALGALEVNEDAETTTSVELEVTAIDVEGREASFELEV